MQIDYKWYSFADFTPFELYKVLKLRQEVFVVEQQCAYLDCDDLDQNGLHLIGWTGSTQTCTPASYLRLVIVQSNNCHSVIPAKPNQTDRPDQPALGRLVCHHDFRGRNLGYKTMFEGIRKCKELYPKSPITISAQQYLVRFYEKLGFRTASEGYLEDGIPHIAMIRDV